MTLPPFPNPERILVAEFDQLAAGRWFNGGSTPRDLRERVPFVTVRRGGGPSDSVNDYPFVTVEIHARTYAEIDDIAEEIRQHLLSPDIISNVHGQIDRAVCSSAHTELPAEDPALRRILTTYRLTCRRMMVGS